MAKTIVRWLLTLAVGVVGIVHFWKPAGFVSIVPAYLRSPLLLVQISGAAEIAGAIGLQAPWPALRRAASFGLIALFVAVFPANLNQALHDIPINGQHVSPIFLWGRLPLQLVLIWLAWWCTRPVARQARFGSALTLLLFASLGVSLAACGEKSDDVPPRPAVSSVDKFWDRAPPKPEPTPFPSSACTPVEPSSFCQPSLRSGPTRSRSSNMRQSSRSMSVSRQGWSSHLVRTSACLRRASSARRSQ